MTIDDEKLRLWLNNAVEWLNAAVESAFRAGAADERAAVVAWLRREIEKCGCDDDTAACIERGEHRREEKP